MQLGIHIPVFVLTRFGKEIVLKYLEKMKSPVVVSRARMPYVVEEKLPIRVHEGEGTQVSWQ